MTITDVFTEAPNGYRPTFSIAWVTKEPVNIFEDRKTILAQLWESEFNADEPDVWVAVPTVEIPRTSNSQHHQTP